MSRKSRKAQNKWVLGEKFSKAGRKRATARKATKRLQKVQDAGEMSYSGKPESVSKATIGGVTARDGKSVDQMGMTGKVSKDVKGAVETKLAGYYPEYPKESKSGGNFRDSFSAARESGGKDFDWQGRKYSTRQAGEGTKWDEETKKWGN